MGDDCRGDKAKYKPDRPIKYRLSQHSANTLAHTWVRSPRGDSLPACRSQDFTGADRSSTSDAFWFAQSCEGICAGTGRKASLVGPRSPAARHNGLMVCARVRELGRNRSRPAPEKQAATGRHPPPQCGGLAGRIPPTTLTLLAIDPGTQRLGFAVWRDREVVTDGIFHVDYELPSDFLNALTAWLDEMRTTYGIECVASERMFDFMAMKGNRRTGGNAPLLKIIPQQMKAWCDLRGLPFLLYSPGTIKLRVTGSGDAEKAAVRLATGGWFTDASRTLPEKHQWDVADAHAVAWTAIMHGYRPLPPKPKKPRTKKKA